MKNKKWLLVIVIAVFVINIGFWALTRLAKMDQLVQAKASNYLAELLDAEVEIGYFTFNDKQANISKLSISENNSLYELNIEQIYVEYDLPKLLFSRFSNFNAIGNITVLAPKLNINLSANSDETGNDSESETASSEFVWPQLENFFRKLSLQQGQISLQIDSNHFTLQESWQDVELQIENDNSSQIRLTASSDSSSLELSSLLQAGKIVSADLQLKDFFPEQLAITAIDSVRAKIDLTAAYSAAEGLSYSGNINDFYASSYQRAVSSNQINFAGDLAETKLNSSLIADGNELQLQASLKDLDQSKRSIRADIALPKIEAERYWSALEGQVSATAAISGALLRPQILVEATATEITAYQQQIPYLSASAEVGFDQLDF
ncbi:MAG: hypothetical protein R6U84_10350, partial [Candidatus Cloacimonadales bacterium]